MTPCVPTEPTHRIEVLLAERDHYIALQEELRAERTSTEIRLLLSMLDEQAVENPSLVQQIRAQYVDDGLPSFGVLVDDWTMIGDELEELDAHQQQVERMLAIYVLDSDWAILADLDDATEAVLTMRDEPFDDRADDTFPTKQ